MTMPFRSAGEFRAADRLLWQTFRRCDGWMMVSVPVTVADLAIRLVEPYLVARCVDAVAGGTDATGWLLSLAVVAAFDLALTVLGVIAGMMLVAGTAARFRRRITDHVLALGTAGRHRHASGDLAARALADVHQTAAFVPMVLGSVVGLGTAAGGTVALGLIDWRLLGVLALGLLLAFLASRAPIADLITGWARYSRTLGEISNRLGDAMRGVLTIRAAGTVEHERERILVPLAELSALGRGMWQAERQMGVRLGLVEPAIQVAVLGVAGFGVAAGQMGVGEFLAATAYLGMALGLLDAIELRADFADARAGASRVAEVLDQRLPVAPDSRPLPPGPGDLKFCRLTVRHPDGRLMVENLNLQVPGGQLVVVVGGADSGASALAAVAGGLLAAERGTALLDGVPITLIDSGDGLDGIGFAPARPQLVGRTVAEAIALGVAEVDPGRNRAAARLACVEEFVDCLPQGFDTVLTEVQMSGGEAQRLGLARALAGNPRLLVLDDATSSLDTATEAAVFAGLAQRQHTRLVVTQRASVAARADLVVWLASGRLRGAGPHMQLWADPRYRAVFEGEPASAAPTPTEFAAVPITTEVGA